MMNIKRITAAMVRIYEVLKYLYRDTGFLRKCNDFTKAIDLVN